MQVPLDEAPGKQLLEAMLERATVVERAGDSEDLRSVVCGCNCRRVAGGAEEHRLEPDARTARGERFAEISRRRAAERVNVERLCRGDGTGGDPVFERVRRVGVLELQQQVDPERLRQTRRLDQRGQARRGHVGRNVRQ